MSSIFNWSIGILVFVLVLMVSVALHELGHLTVAKKLKVHVSEYFVGFGKTLWSTQKGVTEYGIKAIPLGGYIRVEDLDQPKDSPDRELLSYIAPWKRVLIFLAGPAVNIVLGTVILLIVLLTFQVSMVTTGVGAVNSCSTSANCAAEKAGFQPGDKIITLNGKSYDNIVGKFTPEEKSTVVVKRDGKEVTLYPVANKEGKIGITLATEHVRRSPNEAFTTIGALFRMNFEALATLPNKTVNVAKALSGQEKRSDDSVSSVIGAGEAYGRAANESGDSFSNKAQTMLIYSGLVNIGLGLVNLLPLLPLDGGRILIAFIDSFKIRWAKLRRKEYKPLEYKWVNTMMIVMGVMVIGFSGLILVADIFVPVGR